MTQKQKGERPQRLAVANRIIEAVGSCGRRFLSTNSDLPVVHAHPRFSRFEMMGNGSLWYVDKYREARVYVSYDCAWRSGWGHMFSDGGTMLFLMRHLRDHITKGAPVNPAYFGPFKQWSCGGDPWGYGADMAVLRAKVDAILEEAKQ